MVSDFTFDFYRLPFKNIHISDEKAFGNIKDKIYLIIITIT